MTKEMKENITYGSAIGMLVFGSALTLAGFIIDPAGQIHDSVLYVLGQCLIFAGSVMGVSAYATGKMRYIERSVKRDIDRRFRAYDAGRHERDGEALQMDDYGMDKRHYGRHGDCTISPTYDDDDTHHCGEDVNEEGGEQ